MFVNRTLKILSVFILWILLFNTTGVAPAHAATLWTVNSINDPGDGICDNLECTLSEATTIAQSGDTINFNLTYPETINLHSEIYLNKDLTITGPGSDNLVIYGEYTWPYEGFSLFGVFTNKTIVLTGLTLSNGGGSWGGGIENYGHLIATDVVFANNSVGTATAASGGAIYNAGIITISDSAFLNNYTRENGGGAIHNKGMLTINNTVFTENYATPYYDGYGGAIYNEGTLEIQQSIFKNNAASARGYNNHGYGGSIYNKGNMSINQSTFSSNIATGNGGGIYNTSTLSVTNSTFLRNEAIGRGSDQDGGGIYNNGTLTVSGSTFLENHTWDEGASILNYNNGSLTITNSSFSNNSAYTYNGGDINNKNELTIINSTIYEGPQYGFYDFGIYDFGVLNYGILAYVNTVIVGSCYNFNTIGVNLNNYIDNGDCPASISGNPNLGPLESNGGYTQTMMLFPNSVAINAGNSEYCPAIDQRGISRTIEGYCDLGSVEFDPSDIRTISGNIGLANISINYTGGTTTADINGYYSFAVYSGWSGMVVPFKVGYTFSPVDKSYSKVSENQATQDYVATAITYTISGNVGIASAILSYTDDTQKTVTADSDGNYSFVVPYNWSGEVTPSKTGYVFYSGYYSNVLSDKPDQNYTPIFTTHTITGYVGLSGAAVNYTGGSVLADEYGYYTVTIPHGWSGSVTPDMVGYTFSPVSNRYENITSDQIEDYAAVQNEYSLIITSANGAVIKNPNQSTYHEGDQVQLIARPNTGWLFSNWTGGLTSNINPNSVTIHGDTSITANYNKIFASSYSLAANDGWTLESSENSNVANMKSNIGYLRVGDDKFNKQYRSLLYFDTTKLPKNAVVTKVTVQITQKEVVTGTDSISITPLGYLIADMKKGFFGLAPLELGDFSALAAPINTAGKFINNSGTYTLTLSPANFKYINLTGTTQFRLRFTKDDNNDKDADYINFYAGNSANPADPNQPQLIIEYYVP